ncbi:MAG: aryl-sulfate sulfotransferase [Planctomycetota bacterium]
MTTSLGPLLLTAFALAPLQDTEEEPTGVLVREPGAFEGYTLYCPLDSGTTYLVGMDGEPVHTWRSELPPGSAIYLQDDGSILRGFRVNENPVFHGGGLGGGIQRITWDGEVTWEYQVSSKDFSQHHDIEPLPNGNVLLIAWEHVAPDMALRLGRDPEVVDDEGWWPDAVYEVKPVLPDGAEVVWEWHAKDHLIQDREPSKPSYGSIPDRPGRIDVNGDHRDLPPETEEERERREKLEEEMAALGYTGGSAGNGRDDKPRESEGRPDWLHTNAVEYNAELDLVMLSTPEFSEIWILDHSTTTEEARGSTGGRYGRGGDLLYRWGNPRTYGRGTADDQILSYQHDPTWIPAGYPGAGNVLILNNGRDRGWSSVDEISLPLAGGAFELEAGVAFGPEAPAWTYGSAAGEFFAPFISGAQRLPNGNTLVCVGPEGLVREVTADGETVWELRNGFGGDIPMSFGNAAERTPPVKSGALFRATRIAPDHPALAGREL